MLIVLKKHRPKIKNHQGPVSQPTKKCDIRAWKPSPGRLTSASTPATPRAKYRESNASRLRQEIKGMAITGVVRQGGRSKSASSNKSRSPSISSNHNSGNATPKLRNGALPLDVVAARLQNSARKNRARSNDSNKTIDLIATPRTMSETSNTSKDARDRIRSVITNPSSAGHVVDTRSKTINTASKLIWDETLKKKKSTSHTNVPQSVTGSGYGKPLLTPVHKKLTVMKDLTQANTKSVKSPVSSRVHSPVRSWRTDLNDSITPVSGRKIDCAKPKSSARGPVLNKSRTAMSKTKPDENKTLKTQVQSKKIKSPSLTGQYNNRSPTRCARSDNHGLTSDNKNLGTSPTREPKTLKTDFNPTFSRQTYRSRISTSNKNSVDSRSSENNEHNIPQPVSRSRVPSIDRKNDKPVSEPFRDLINERLKQQHSKDAPITGIVRPNSGIYSRTFKPQLEDIKSSFMLLNKKPDQCGKDKGKNIESKIKPKILDEEYRRQQIMEVRKKFQSKHFWDDAKYDKIEGLNWISWK